MSKPSNSLVFSPPVFEKFPEIMSGMSLRNTSRPGNFSQLARGTTEEIAQVNREAFAEMLGATAADLAFPHLQHADKIVEIDAHYSQADRVEADAYITQQPGRLIGVGVADCVVVLVYDPTHRAVAVVHSGWRGTVAEIVPKALAKLTERYHSRPGELYAWLSPAPDRSEYEVGHEVSQQFDRRYITKKNEDKDWLDNRLAVQDHLLAAGVPATQIAVDPRSTIANPQLHSYRRDGEESGRMMVAIGLRRQPKLI